MPFRADESRLRDILENIEAIRGFVAGRTFADFTADRMLNYAVTRALEIISEASRHLPDDLKSRRPEIPWRAIAAAGNVYRHAYRAVDSRTIWHTATAQLGALEAVVRAELDRAASR
jgi:uncharacterized protein with HEPN domain